jgi:TIR domain
MSKVFISYSHADRAWAAKVADSLQRLGFQFFFDRASLRAGSNWEGQILQSLLQCDHLVVLWSEQAQASDWVSRERARFEAAWQKLNLPLAPGHALVHILLDNPRSAYDSYQHISEILDAGAYATGADAVPGALWQQVVDRLGEALGQVSLPITRAIVALEQKELKDREVDFNWAPKGGRSLAELLEKLGIKPEQLTDYYGATREKWKPFRGDQTIQQILEGIKNQLNGMPGATAIRWAPVEEELFADNRDLIERATTKLANTVSLIIIDPVALYSQTIRQLVQDDLTKCFENPHAVVAALPLFPALPEPRTHQEMVKQVYRSLVDRFYGESPGLNRAICSIFTPDDEDIKRLVRATVRHLAVADAEPENPFLRISRR